MSEETLRWALIWGGTSVFGAWLLSSFFFRVAGEWVRLHADEQGPATRTEERFQLHQIGPYVSGHCVVPGGHQTLSGFVVGRTLHLRRRDYGVKHLERQGFPQEVARRLEGQVFARFELKLQPGGNFLEGEILPRRIEFTHQPPRITGIFQAKPAPRTYRRVEPLAVADAVDAWNEEVSAPSTRL